MPGWNSRLPTSCSGESKLNNNNNKKKKQCQHCRFLTASQQKQDLHLHFCTLIQNVQKCTFCAQYIHLTAKGKRVEFFITPLCKFFACDSSKFKQKKTFRTQTEKNVCSRVFNFRWICPVDPSHNTLTHSRTNIQFKNKTMLLVQNSVLMFIDPLTLSCKCFVSVCLAYLLPGERCKGESLYHGMVLCPCNTPALL